MKRVLLYAWCAMAWAQAPAAKSFFGTIVSFKADAAEVVVKPETADTVSVKLGPATIFQRIAPGEKDLKKAEPMNATDMAIDDRVLVTLESGTTQARRIVVMSARDISKKNEADRLDWAKRGTAGVVASKKGNEITLRIRTLAGQTTATVIVGSDTKYHRYAPDSVKFADAKSSKLDEVSPGDQLRARGQKAEDGSKVTAEEVVFGTFVTKAGTITAVNAETKEITKSILGAHFCHEEVVRIAEHARLQRRTIFRNDSVVPKCNEFSQCAFGSHIDDSNRQLAAK